MLPQRRSYRINDSINATEVEALAGVPLILADA
jgi:hypothetical protein